MRQALHLLIVDCDRRSALTTAYGTRWLLPVLQCDERTRAAAAVARWAVSHGPAGAVVGHWLGRVARDAVDWLVVIRASPRCGAADARLEWMSLQALASGSALLDYQQWAIEKALQGGPLPSVSGPFGNLAWLAEAKNWIRAIAGAEIDDLTPYRVGAHEVVLGARTVRGRVYFKGLAGDRGTEARLTRALSALVPDAFAATLALEHRPDGSTWWLTAECPGQPGRRADVVAQTLARIQCRSMTTRTVLGELRALNLKAAAEWAAELVDDHDIKAAVTHHCNRVEHADVPRSWIPLDLDPTNVLVDDDGAVRFIDLDDSFAGPAPLAMAVLAQRCRDASLYRPYEQSWSPSLKCGDWRDFQIAATVAEAWLGWKRVNRNTARGDVHGAIELASVRLRDRLSRAVYRR